MILNREILLMILILLSAPAIASAQNGLNILPGSLSTDNLTGATGMFVNIPDDTHYLYNMPVFKPESNAAIRIYEPPEKILYNLPVFGLQDSLRVKPKRFDLKRDSIAPKE